MVDWWLWRQDKVLEWYLSENDNGKEKSDSGTWLLAASLNCDGLGLKGVLFHILPEFVASNNFYSLSNPVQTVAGKDPERLPLNMNALGNSVNISTRVVNASIVGVVYSDNKLSIYKVDKILLPLDFFQKAKPPTLAPTALAKVPKATKENIAASDIQDNTTTPNLKKFVAVW
ncbi:hypothetical protein PIB30_040216 [Stylosanthes scabra]|uniref:FAS1 domain-containing protein n=1 Tax=Stylosanthes scabra TaxID=79078 RepID=A0ABU6SEV9_9FABA|nr:hypothetical protein [Stylosanthes scabra]